mmetsp:Transcript_10961/g.27322  ORF Transcript_10961/g.27322 Transcript_10961/m.27322 type:complete len:308 (+) Transcript_10961:714-1637(+)
MRNPPAAIMHGNRLPPREPPALCPPRHQPEMAASVHAPAAAVSRAQARPTERHTADAHGRTIRACSATHRQPSCTATDFRRANRPLFARRASDVRRAFRLEGTSLRPLLRELLGAARLGIVHAPLLVLPPLLHSLDAHRDLPLLLGEVRAVALPVRFAPRLSQRRLRGTPALELARALKLRLGRVPLDLRGEDAAQVLLRRASEPRELARSVHAERVEVAFHRLRVELRDSRQGRLQAREEAARGRPRQPAGRAQDAQELGRAGGRLHYKPTETASRRDTICRSCMRSRYWEPTGAWRGDAPSQGRR